MELSVHWTIQSTCDACMCACAVYRRQVMLIHPWLCPPFTLPCFHVIRQADADALGMRVCSKSADAARAGRLRCCGALRICLCCAQADPPAVVRGHRLGHAGAARVATSQCARSAQAVVIGEGGPPAPAGAQGGCTGGPGGTHRPSEAQHVCGQRCRLQCGGPGRDNTACRCWGEGWGPEGPVLDAGAACIAWMPEIGAGISAPACPCNPCQGYCRMLCVFGSTD